ncbi:hypothetical protein CKAN_00513000 [Cinnamomum micranthum f. kanehirae]|uniref:Uncharacterized protein n=1 Tax=Cinnamomum micranthum f. kanehirae TaxID=337451 RepID=A0A3S4NFU7_9MAGN|nr:hypothetical protein CKAN_00513000 [Cinnamomum micranthum f. kanehirae]
MKSLEAKGEEGKTTTRLNIIRSIAPSHAPFSNFETTYPASAYNSHSFDIILRFEIEIEIEIEYFPPFAFLIFPFFTFSSSHFLLLRFQDLSWHGNHNKIISKPGILNQIMAP